MRKPTFTNVGGCAALDHGDSASPGPTPAPPRATLSSAEKTQGRGVFRKAFNQSYNLLCTAASTARPGPSRRPAVSCAAEGPQPATAKAKVNRLQCPGFIANSGCAR